MKLLRRKKVKLNFVLAAMASCFCMLLVTPIIGEQFGFANSFSNIYLDGEHIGAIKDPANVESLLLDARLALAKPDVFVMHPGPVNRGVELSSAVIDGDKSVINEQVKNGVAIRMAVMHLIMGNSFLKGVDEV